MLTNAFSLNMLPAGFSGCVSVGPATPDDARDALRKGGSAVGHADTAAVFSTLLGVAVPTERKTVVLDSGALVVVGQYRGPRLPEGATSLPPGAAIDWIAVWVAGEGYIPRHKSEIGD